MQDPNLNYLYSDSSRASERYNERLREAEAHRLANVALGRDRASRRRPAAWLLQPLRALLPGVLRMLRVGRRPALSAEQAVNEP